MTVVEWRQTAIGDLIAILDDIADDNPDAAQRLKDAIDARTAELSKHPRLYRTGRVAGTREMVVHPNYVVVYAQTPEVISILRVLPAAQQWQSTEG